MNKTFYISTPIYYPSGKPHVGHAYSTILADALAKYKKLIGYDTFFLTGTDEHGKKLEEAALKANVPLMQYIDNNVNIFIDLWKKLGVDYSKFIRTTDEKHMSSVQKVFSQYLKDDLIYLDSWKGLYCVNCEENILQKDTTMVDGKMKCPVGHDVISTEEPSYFFKMSKYNDWIVKTFDENKNWISPISRVNELKNNFLENNLTDLSISRTSFNWGIKIKENPEHVIYVWMDALFNYVTALNFMEEDKTLFDRYWNHEDAEIVHLLSKEITRFHCVYWPIFLHALNIKLPTKIISHGWIVTKDGKMSKSLGNVIDPFEITEVYTRDCLRYYLLKEMSLLSDNVFSIETMEGVYNGDLANNVGNLLSRTLGMLEKYTNKICPEFKEENLDNYDIEIKELIVKTNADILNSINELNISNILDSIQQLVNATNKYIENKKPWEIFKANDFNQLNAMLNILVNVNKVTFFWLQPVLIDGCIEAGTQLGINFAGINHLELNNLNLVNGIMTNKGNSIFERILKQEN
ncbi:MAG: methionine--tRNA ligase [Mycoplasma sp.]